MCAILDANVAHEVFGADPPPAGQGFLEWIDAGSGRLVAGGKLLEELEAGSVNFRKWARTALRVGKMRLVNYDSVNSRIDEIESSSVFRSNDPHVIALAQVSGARLLYSNDSDLQQDFKDKSLIDNPRGRVYSTLERKSLTPSHRRLLGRQDLCRIDQ